MTKNLMEDGILSPTILKNYLDQYVIGQDEAKKILANTIFLHVAKSAMYMLSDRDYGAKSNTLVTGPTGCGKTYMCRRLADLVGLPFMEISAKDITNEGFIGNSFSDHLTYFYEDFNGREDPARLEHGIIFIDEVDKICLKYSTASGDDHNMSIQHTLLKAIEGASYQLSVGKSRVTINTHNMLFILAGNFESVRQLRKLRSAPTMGFSPDTKSSEEPLAAHGELVRCGMSPEFAGRISMITEVYKPTRAEMRKALMNELSGPHTQYKALFDFLGYEFELSYYMINKILDRCESLQTGMRGLQSATDMVLAELVSSLELDLTKLEEE